MGIWDILLGSLGIGGAFLDYGQNMEDRQWVKDQTAAAGDRVEGLRDRLFNGTDQYGGVIDIANQMLPQFESLASGVKQGAKDLQGQVSSGYSQLGSEIQNLINGTYGGLDAGYDSFIKGLEGRMGGLQKDMGDAYADRTAKGMSMLEGMGEQSRKHINQNYANLQGKTQSNLASRGLGGTGVGASMARGIEREKNNSLGRLDENLREQKFNAYSGLSGDELASKSNLGLSGINLSRGLGSERLQTQERGGMAQAEAAGKIGTSALNSMSDLGQWGLGASTAADEYALGQKKDTMMLPHQMDQYLTELLNGTMLSWGPPPEVPSFLTRAQTSLVPMYAAAKQPKPEKQNPFSFGISI